MGVSSDGILYFGFQVGEEDSPPEWLGRDDEGEPRDFEDFLLSKAGLPHNATYEDRRKVVKACPAELQLFCSYDWPMFILGFAALSIASAVDMCRKSAKLIWPFPKPRLPNSASGASP